MNRIYIINTICIEKLSLITSKWRLISTDINKTPILNPKNAETVPKRQKLSLIKLLIINTHFKIFINQLTVFLARYSLNYLYQTLLHHYNNTRD